MEAGIWGTGVSQLAPTTSSSHVRIGDQVIITGLLSNLGYNGKTGEIVGFQKGDRGMDQALLVLDGRREDGAKAVLLRNVQLLQQQHQQQQIPRNQPVGDNATIEVTKSSDPDLGCLLSDMILRGVRAGSAAERCGAGSLTGMKLVTVNGMVVSSKQEASAAASQANTPTILLGFTGTRKIRAQSPPAPHVGQSNIILSSALTSPPHQLEIPSLSSLYQPPVRPPSPIVPSKDTYLLLADRNADELRNLRTEVSDLKRRLNASEVIGNNAMLEAAALRKEMDELRLEFARATIHQHQQQQLQQTVVVANKGILGPPAPRAASPSRQRSLSMKRSVTPPWELIPPTASPIPQVMVDHSVRAVSHYSPPRSSII